MFAYSSACFLARDHRDDSCPLGELRLLDTGHGTLLPLAVRTLPRVVGVLLLDLSLRNKTGMDVLAELMRRAPELRVLVVTMHVSRPLMDMALKLGARGYIPKNAPLEELVAAIEEVLAGHLYHSPRIPHKTHRGGQLAPPIGFSRLTPREQQIVRRIGQGLTTAAIAERLGLSPPTVHYHRQEIRGELGMRSEIEFTRYALLATLNEAESASPADPGRTRRGRV